VLLKVVKLSFGKKGIIDKSWIIVGRNHEHFWREHIKMKGKVGGESCI
jgi:predicted small secreted protein